MTDHERSPFSEDRFDALLAEAKWPDPADSARRVEAVWDSITPVHRAGVIGPWISVAAACLVLGGIAAVLISRPHRPETAVNDPPPDAVQQKAAFPSRPPNPWELAAIRETLKPRNIRERPVTIVLPPRRPTLREQLARHLEAGEVDVYLKYVRDPATRGVALSAADDVPHPPLNSLLAALDDPHESVRIAAARTLGHIDGPVTTAALIRRMNARVNQRETLAALVFSDGPEANRFLLAAQSDPTLAAQVRTLQLQRSTLQ